jgi:hypothetical protein
MAGGEEALKKFSSTYTPDTRMPHGVKAKNAAEGISSTDIINRYHEHKNRKHNGK